MLHKGRSCQFFYDFFDGTAKVNIDDRRAAVFIEFCGFGHDLGVVASQLNGDRKLFAIVIMRGSE